MAIRIKKNQMSGIAGIKDGMQIKNHGGPRKGSGRPKSEPTKILTFRVKAKDAEIIRAKIKALLKK